METPNGLPFVHVEDEDYVCETLVEGRKGSGRE